MNSRKSLFVIALVAILALSSCSGLKNKCTTNCGGGTGNAALSITISDAPPTNATVVSFTLPIIGITLTPSTGSPVSVFSTGNFELTRLQSDTNLIVSKKEIAAGTYTAINVTVSAPSGVFANTSTGSLGSCPSGDFCSITGNAATITFTFSTPLTLTANANQWLNLDFNYNKAIVSSNGALSIDMTQTGVMTASTAIPTGVASGAFANIDDFTGQVTAVSSSSITVKSTIRGTLTVAITSSTLFFDPQNQCSGGASLSCIQTGSVVSVQSLLLTSGVPTASSIDVIDVSTKPTDEVEGIIYPSTCNGGSNFGMILRDSLINTSGSPLTSASFGAGLCLSVAQISGFVVDSGILTTQPGVPSGANIPGFQSTSDILAGQMVRAKVTGATSGTNGIINANTALLMLRFSRLTGTINTTTGTSFSIANLPPYLGTFSVPPQVITYINATLLEGETSVGNLTGTVSMSALFLNVGGGAQYWFQAAKVRQD